MTNPQQLAGAAASIAEALRPLPPEDRENAVKIAMMMCPAQAVKATRRDKGKKRKAADEPVYASVTDAAMEAQS
jgi:hypothetical protein